MRVYTQQLRNELQWVSRFVETKSTIPIVQSVLLESSKQGLKLTATDLEIGGITEVQGHGKGDWAVAIPPRLLLKYLAKVEEPELDLVAGENNWLTLKHGPDSSTRTAGMSKESFPELPKAPSLENLSGLEAALPRILPTISTEVSRFTLNGALLDTGNRLMVSTDGHRLSSIPIQYLGVASRTLLPVKALRELVHLKASSISFGTDEHHAFFKLGERRIITRKLTGNFPDWNRVQPKDFPYAVLVDADALAKVVQRVAVYADERSHAVTFHILGGTLAVHSSACETGDATGSVPILGGQPGVIEIGLNALYALDFLTLSKGETVAFCYKDSQSAVEFVSKLQWRCVIMPMRT